MLLGRVLDYVQTHGLRYTVRRAGEKASERVLHRYHRIWQSWQLSEDELRYQREHQPDAGLISVVIPVYNTDPGMLRALADSLLAQTYARWEACLYDGCSTKPETRAMLREIAALDPRIHAEPGTANDGISGNTNRAIDMAQGAYCALLDHDDLLAPDALWRAARAIEQTGADMLYSDEDKVTEDGRWHTDPHLKPDFGPDTLRSGNYICHMMVLKTELIRRASGLRPAFDGSQDHDLALRCSEMAERVVHLPYVLYHWRTVGASMSHQKLRVCQDAACRAVEEQMARMGYPGEAVMERGVMRLRYRVPETVSVRVLCIGCAAFPAAGEWQNAVVQRVENSWHAVNEAALSAGEDVLLLYRGGDVRSADFLREMLMYAQRDDVGAVCPVLLDRQHPKNIACAGMALMHSGSVSPRHAHQPFAGGGLRAQALTSHNVAAMSTACVMVRRDHMLPFDPADGDLAMVRWCMKLSDRGLHHVYTPHAVLAVTDGQLDLPVSRLTPALCDPTISPYYTSGDRADFKL